MLNLIEMFPRYYMHSNMYSIVNLTALLDIERLTIDSSTVLYRRVNGSDRGGAFNDHTVCP